jgi:capsule biosynthesis phosphatase
MNNYNVNTDLLKRICVDFDGTICETKKPGQSYTDVLPLPGAIESLKELKSKGYEIVIHTARNMATHSNNVAKVTAVQAPIIIEWCKKWDCPFDELFFGKPHVDFFIDDKGITFTTWEEVKQIIYKKEQEKLNK